MELFSQPWADAVRDALNAGPTAEYRATKLDMYWDWIGNKAADFDGSVAYGCTGMPDGDRYVLLRFEAGRCVEAGATGRQPDATFILVGSFDDWQAILAGYDTNKAVMYRKIALEAGDVYAFFRRAYFFTEMLASVARVPAAVPTPV